MKQLIDFRQLSWPRGLNLEYLRRVMSEEDFRQFIVSFSQLDRKKRRIMLPSRSCIRKTLCHYYWRMVEDGSKTWDQIKSDLRKEFGSLRVLGIQKSKVIRFYRQREKEIKREKK